MRVKRLAGLCLAGLLGLSASGMESVVQQDLSAQAESSLQATWVFSLTDLVAPPDEHLTNYDEQIFTEFSPVLDSPGAVKLPADQRYED